jgi:hypothetical protein
MNTITAKWRMLAAASVAAASLAACHDDNAGIFPAPRMSAEFSTFTDNTFANSANSKPVSLDGVEFVFDVNDNPTAFDALIMSGVY